MASDQATRILANLKRQGQTEALTYRPAGGEPRTIDATVSRDGTTQQMHTRAALAHVTVLNDAELGIATAGDDELDRGADRLEVAKWPGGTPVPRTISIISADSDWITLAVV